MKTFHILTIAALSLFTISCGSGKQQEEKTEETYEDSIDEKTGISSLQTYDRSDTVTVGGMKYKYKFVFQPEDSLPHVSYPATGAEYYDNAVNLVITQNGQEVIKKSFTKSSFKSYVPAKLYNTGGLIGFAYNEDRKLRHQNDAFYFIATIGNLDDQEEIAYSLEIKIDTAGGMSISEYQESETEPQSNGLNVDPNDDGV